METTLELLEAVRAKRKATYYGLQAILGVSKQTITRYRKRRGFFDDDVAITVADELGLPHAHVLAIIAAERAKSEQVKKAWQRAAAATATVLAALLGAEHGAQLVDALSAAAPTLYIMSNVALFLATLAAVGILSRATTRRNP